MHRHVNNVSCVLFQSGKGDFIVSSSEDKTVRVWDAKKNIGIRTFYKDHDRFWILASPHAMNLLASGYDSGIQVFKWERECPVFSVSGDFLLYFKDQFLDIFNYSTGKVFS